MPAYLRDKFTEPSDPLGCLTTILWVVVIYLVIKSVAGL